MNIILIGGENPVFIREELERTIQQFPESDRVIYYGDELQNDVFFADIRTGSLFVAQQMIVVREASKTNAEFEKLLLEYLKDPSDTVLLVLEYAKIPTKVLNATEKLGNTRAKVHQFKKAWAQDISRYTQRRLDDHGISITRGALEMIVSFSGDQIEETAGMLDKLISYAGENTSSINEEVIEHVLERAQNASIFDLIEAIFTHNSARAIQSYRDLLHVGESFPAITAMFYRGTKIMWAVKTSTNGQQHEGFGISPYEWKKYQAYNRQNSLRFVSQCFECIQQLEIQSKTQNEIFAQSTFEIFLSTL